jgi:phosphopantothenate synthetase
MFRFFMATDYISHAAAAVIIACKPVLSVGCNTGANLGE